MKAQRLVTCELRCYGQRWARRMRLAPRDGRRIATAAPGNDNAFASLAHFELMMKWWTP